MDRISCLIVAAAPCPDPQTYVQIVHSAENVIAVDGGVDLCKALGRAPGQAVGDFDSVSPEGLSWAEASGCHIIALPVDKDESDLDVALQHAVALGFTTATVLCALSGRLDHTIATLGAAWRAPSISLTFWSPEFEAHVLSEHSRSRLIVPEEGRGVSLLAGPGGAIVTMAGFRFPLLRGQIPELSSLGISNVTETSGARIEVHEGTVMAILS